MKFYLFQKLENSMAAVTFAEKNDSSYALVLMNGQDKKQKYSRRKLKKQQDNRPRMRL